MVKLSVLVIGLSVFSISSCYNLGKLYISEDLSVSTTLSILLMYQFNSVQSLSPFRLFVTPWTAAHQTSPSITNSQSLLKLMSIESVMPSNHFILCCPLLLPPSVFLSIRVFSNESFLRSGGQSIGASASVSVLPMNIQD